MHLEESDPLVHALNQRYKAAWERAERLQAELDDIRGSRAWRLVQWLRSIRGWFRGKRRVAAPLAWQTQLIEPAPEPPRCGVSIIIPFRNQPRLLVSLLHGLTRTRYRRFEVILVDNGSDCPQTRRLLERLRKRRRHRIVAAPGPFNFASLCAAGARQARGRFLLLLNNDIEVLHSDWLGNMLCVAACPGVGVVGATLLYPDGTLQHAGIFPETDGRWSHAYRGQQLDELGPAAELRRVRTVPAVTGACLMIRHDLFEEMGGLREDLPITGNDVDLCCRVRARGLVVALTPHARLVHYESLSRGYARDDFQMESTNR